MANFSGFDQALACSFRRGLFPSSQSGLQERMKLCHTVNDGRAGARSPSRLERRLILMNYNGSARGRRAMSASQLLYTTA
jgi:hypothetical protein